MQHHPGFLVFKVSTARQNQDKGSQSQRTRMPILSQILEFTACDTLPTCRIMALEQYGFQATQVPRMLLLRSQERDPL